MYFQDHFCIDLTHLRSASWDSVRPLYMPRSNSHSHRSHSPPDCCWGHCPGTQASWPPWRWRIPWGRACVSCFRFEFENFWNDILTRCAVCVCSVYTLCQRPINPYKWYLKKISKIREKQNNKHENFEKLVNNWYCFGLGHSVLGFVLTSKVFRAVVKFDYYTRTHTHAHTVRHTRCARVCVEKM